MKWIILITMFMFDPYHVGDDSVVMISQHDKPLIFKSLKECGEHVEANLPALIHYANMLYKNEGVVKQVLCVEDLKRGDAV